MTKRNGTFNDDWLIEFEWVEKGPNAGTVYCQLFHLTFDISNMERSAVTNHSKGKKHKNKEISRKSLFNNIFCKKKSSVVSLTVSDLDKKQCPSVPSLSSDVQHKRQRTLSLLKSGVTEAEMLWTVKTVLTHSLSKLFTLGRTMHFITFDIGVYLKELLVANLTSFDFFVTCYDESLNDTLIVCFC